MPGIRFKIDVSEAEVASKRLRKDLKDLGFETGLTEKEIKKLEGRMIKGMGADKAKVALDRVAKSVGMTKREVVALQLKSGQLGRAFASFKTGAGAVTKSILSMKTAIVGLAGAYGLGRVFKSFLGAAKEAEGFRVRLNALLGSVADGNKLFQAMAKYASEVPFQYAEIMNAATMLSGVMRGGVEEIKRWMPMIGDLAAASGLDIATTTGQIIRMYSAGASAADLFRERGILAMMGFKSGVRYTVEDTKRIMFTAWDAVDSKFKGVTKELAKTWEGLMSMISDKWFQLRNLVMEAGIYDALKEALSGINEEFAAWISNNKELIGQRVPEYVDKIKSSVSGLIAVYQSLPEGIVGAAGTGILARILFGSWKPAAIIAGVMLLKAQLEKFEKRTLEGIELELIRKGVLLGTDEQRLAILKEDLELLKEKRKGIIAEIEHSANLMKFHIVDNKLAKEALADRYKQLKDNTGQIHKTRAAIKEINKLLRVVPAPIPALPPPPGVPPEVAIDPKELAKIEKAQAKLTDTYNKAVSDRFEYAMSKYWEEFELNTKIANMKVTALIDAGATGRQLQDAELERYRLLGEVATIYTGKVKKLEEEKNEAIRKSFQGVINDWRKGFEQIPEIAKTTSIEQLTAMRNMYEDMRGYGEEYFDVITRLIDRQAQAYKDLGIKEVAVDKWTKNEKKKLSKARTKIVLDETAAMMSNWTSAFEFFGRQNKKYFEIYKTTATLETMISTYQGAQDAFTSLAKIPYVGVALGIAAAAAATAAGLARVTMIQSQVYQGYAAGGWLDTHPKGGKINEGAGGRDDVFLGATPGVAHWGMKDEFVMNKESARKFGPILEMMNRGLAKGGWVHRGYGPLDFITDPISNVAETITGAIETISDPTKWTAGDILTVFGLEPVSTALLGAYEDYVDSLIELAEIKFDPDAFAGILYSIDQMLRKTTALDDMIFSTQQQFKEWIKQLEAMNASEEQLAQVRDQEAVVIAHLTEEMQEGFLKPLEDIVAKNVMTDYGYQLLQLSKWYEEQKQLAIDLGLSLDTLNAAYHVQRQEIEDTRMEIEEGITRRLGELMEAAVPGAGLTPTELALYDLTQEFVELMEKIKGWAVETGESYDELIDKAKQTYKLEMEAALAQSEAAQEIQDSISEWTSIVKDIDDTIYGLQTTLASPATAMERMGFVKGMIEAFPEVTTPEQAAELQELWMDYLKLAQETYQRPSSAYQEIWGDVISALEDIKGDAESFVSGYEIDLQSLVNLENMSVSLDEISANIMAGIPVNLALTTEDFTVIVDAPVIPPVTVTLPEIPDVDVTVAIPDVSVDVVVNETILNAQTTVLEQIRANTYAIAQMSVHTFNIIERGERGAGFLPPVYAKYGGVFSGPESGYPVIMHGREEVTVTPLSNGGSNQMNLTINVNESRNPRDTGKAVRKEVEGFFRSGPGRKLVQQTAVGRG